ncbi:MAG: hypothetical protein KKB91_04325 [Proteobacteria bacterium]|nr:hypothetical protein [Desulfocapsa sp.]MBU3945646.1 hypothetical protein [Pseudomonadota bacterium]MCG2745891.1 hypothetical protein [Desulfobacteraceae bacterium]MBU4107521.1 hypothetical protein [Pseudomonadota bacterium]MBU4169048.1 hypothetical protein [Pseudomonadota bacterium]
MPLKKEAATSSVILFFCFQPEGNHLLQQARKNIALNKTVLMSGGALIGNSFIEAVGNDAKGMYFIGPVRHAGPGVDQMDAVYEKNMGRRHPSVII